jgi:hypothetical protein
MVRTSSRHVPQRIKVRVALAQGFKCAICTGKLDERFECDHIVPVARGGGNDSANLQALCPGCHRTKTETDNDVTRRFTLPRMFGRMFMRLFNHTDGTTSWYSGVVVNVRGNNLDVVYIDQEKGTVSVEDTEDRTHFRFLE